MSVKSENQVNEIDEKSICKDALIKTVEVLNKNLDNKEKNKGKKRRHIDEEKEEEEEVKMTKKEKKIKRIKAINKNIRNLCAKLGIPIKRKNNTVTKKQKKSEEEKIKKEGIKLQEVPVEKLTRGQRRKLKEITGGAGVSSKTYVKKVLKQKAKDGKSVEYVEVNANLKNLPSKTKDNFPKKEEKEEKKGRKNKYALRAAASKKNKRKRR